MADAHVVHRQEKTVVPVQIQLSFERGEVPDGKSFGHLKNHIIRCQAGCLQGFQ